MIVHLTFTSRRSFWILVSQFHCFCAIYSMHPSHAVIQGYSRSDVLKKPTSTMSATIVLPSASANKPQVVPYPKAYERAKNFLKVVLRDELALAAKVKDNCLFSVLIETIGPKAIVEEFQRQLLAYARSEYPFGDSLVSGDTLSWWETLVEHPHARVLAVCAPSSLHI